MPACPTTLGAPPPPPWESRRIIFAGGAASGMRWWWCVETVPPACPYAAPPSWDCCIDSSSLCSRSGMPGTVRSRSLGRRRLTDVLLLGAGTMDGYKGATTE